MKYIGLAIKWIVIWFGCAVTYEMMRQSEEQDETI